METVIVPEIVVNLASIPEKVTKRKILMYQSRLDYRSAALTAEKMKTRLFTTSVFLKPKAGTVHTRSIEKYYEPYLTIQGEYSIDYSKKWIQNIEVNETMQELTLFDKKVRPESLDKSSVETHKVVKFSGEGRYTYINKQFLIFDKNWHEVGIELLPYAPFEKRPQRIFRKYRKQHKPIEIPAEKEIALLKSKIAQRPSDVEHLHKEVFTVLEHAVIYKPMYKFTFQHLKTKKEAAVTIDAVTGNIIRDELDQTFHINLSRFKDLKQTIQKKLEKVISSVKTFLKNNNLLR